MLCGTPGGGHGLQIHCVRLRLPSCTPTLTVKKMFTNEQIKEIDCYLQITQGKVYMGADSQAYKRYSLEKGRFELWASYAVVLVVHINSSNGCKIFSYREHERVYDPKVEKPRLRLMSEVYKTVQAYLALGEILEGRDVQIHLDINPNRCHESNSVAKQAIGYVKGCTNLDAVIKPDAWAGSSTADAVVRMRLAS